MLRRVLRRQGHDRHAQAPADRLRDLPELYAFLGYGMVGGVRSISLQGEPIQAGRVG